MKPEAIKQNLVAALEYFSEDLNSDNKETATAADVICSHISNSLILVEASLTLPENDKARKMQLLTAEEIAQIAINTKVKQTGVDFGVAA
ncbi:MAG: hypothetical protein RL154_1354 [Pseudomonadota bacterium]|jgi:hypothetical protein